MKLHWLFMIAIFVFSSCAVNKSNVLSGRTTEKGHFKAGINGGVNVSSLGVSIDGDVFIQDTVVVDNMMYIYTRVDKTVDIQTFAITHVLDPIGLGLDYYVQYGLLTNYDVGVRFDNSGLFFNNRYQFLGSKSNVISSNFDGNIGVEGSYHKFKRGEGDEVNGATIPGYEQPQIFGYTLNRKSLKVPLTFSRGLGVNGIYGHIGLGTVYNYTNVDLSVYVNEGNEVYDIFVDNDIKTSGSYSGAYHSFGGFINYKVGYKYVYLVGSVSYYYQKYGDFTLLTDEQIKLYGSTIIPTLGVQFNF